MGKKLKRYQLKNQCLFDTIYDRFRDLAVSRFEWEGLPDTVDARYIEYTLFHQGTLSFLRTLNASGFNPLFVMITGALPSYSW